MKNTFRFVLRHYIFWLSIFIFFRIIFLITVVPLPDGIGTAELLHTLVAGIKLDLSTATYFFAIPFLLLLILIAGGDRFIFRSMNWYYSLIVLMVTLLSLSNIIIYKNWGTLLNSRALAYVAQPREMLASVSTLRLVLLVLIISMLFVVIRYFYLRFLHPALEKINGTTVQRLSACVIVLPVMAIGLRGGIQLIPVNESSAVFSNHRVLNQVAINNIWYLGHNLNQSGLRQENPYRWMTAAAAEKVVKQLVNRQSTSHRQVFNISGKPNVVIILLESWTADIIEPLGGVKGVTPRFTELCKEGLLFTSVYSSGFRTDQALVSVLSGFPSQPNNSIIRFPDKTSHLPSLAFDLKRAGYKTSFYYGGELGFANMNNYLVSSGFEKITSIDDFESDHLNSKWGAHDEYVLTRQENDLVREREPFFSTLLTLSTHEPFEVPVETPFNGTSEPEMFKKSAWYTDYCLGNYFDKVKKTEWYPNTIFVLLADHGHRLPLKRDYLDPDLRKIPVLFWSPLLKNEHRGITNSAVSAQHDIAATLLAGLSLPHTDYEWSNDMLDSTRNNFAYLSLDMAVTWIQDSVVATIPLEKGLPGYELHLPAQNNGRGYLQHLYSTFLAY